MAQSRAVFVHDSVQSAYVYGATEGVPQGENEVTWR